ncbi:unnamed protein product [Lampetra fluviatilis]
MNDAAGSRAAETPEASAGHAQPTEVQEGEAGGGLATTYEDAPGGRAPTPTLGTQGGGGGGATLSPGDEVIFHRPRLPQQQDGLSACRRVRLGWGFCFARRHHHGGGGGGGERSSCEDLKPLTAKTLAIAERQGTNSWLPTEPSDTVRPKGVKASAGDGVPTPSRAALRLIAALLSSPFLRVTTARAGSRRAHVTGLLAAPQRTRVAVATTVVIGRESVQRPAPEPRADSLCSGRRPEAAEAGATASWARVTWPLQGDITELRSETLSISSRDQSGIVSPVTWRTADTWMRAQV